jgi:hypothetical protein
MWLVFFPLEPSMGEVENNPIKPPHLEIGMKLHHFALIPCKVTAPIFFRSPKLDSAPLYFCFRVSAKDRLENIGIQKTVKILKYSSFDLSETNFHTIKVYVADRILEMQFKRYQYLTRRLVLVDVRLVIMSTETPSWSTSKMRKSRKEKQTHRSSREKWRRCWRPSRTLRRAPRRRRSRRRRRVGCSGSTSTAPPT